MTPEVSPRLVRAGRGNMQSTTMQQASMVRGTARMGRPATKRSARTLQQPSVRGTASLMGSVCRAPGPLPVMHPRPAGRTTVIVGAVNGLGAAVDKLLHKKTAEPVKVNCRVYSQEGGNTKLDVLLSFVGKDGYQVGAVVDLSTFAESAWEDPVVKDDKGKPVKLGVKYEGEVDIPQDAVDNLLFMRLKTDACVDKEFINKVEISKDRDGDGDVISIAPNSWIHKSQGGRFFFAKGMALLPKDTPAELAPWRAAELEDIKGTMVQRAGTRDDWDRIYDYDVYNDLAGYDKAGNLVARNILGGPEHPYPRRMRTGRPRIRGPDGRLTYETRDMKNSKAFWVPLDERFNTTKATNFQTYTLLAAVPTAAEAVRRKLFDRDDKLTNFKEVDSMYAKLKDKNFTISPKDFIGAMASTAGAMRGTALKLFGIDRDDLPTLQLPGFGGVNLGAVSSSLENVKKLVGGVQNLTEFPPPLVMKNRPGVWDTDEEWGRQALAGVNPSSIKAINSQTAKDLMGGITEAHIKDSLQGHSMLALIAAGATEPRLLAINHTAVFEDYAPKIRALKDGRYGYSGRAILYNTNEGTWVPIAIELKTSEGVTTVYTKKDHKNVWRLAKGVLLSLDSGFHQLVTHWLRCHACTEPYIIATHRCLSSLHPVYKLMVPHWRFTPQINANARQALIAADGIIESCFTPGPYAIEMSSAVYNALWRFDKQGLPADLEDRGLAKKGADGKVQLLLKDYPYADDGMLIWDAVHEWVGKYLHCYYDDSKPGKTIAEDEELNAWWEEIKTKGHPDKKEGWPELKTIADLTEILTTMIWVASAHHAAINFSQYGYTGFFLNRPTLCTRAIPQKDTPGYQALVKDDAAGEQAYLDTLSSSKTVRAILTVELLSTHADNEVYLDDPNHAYILDQKALHLYGEFVAKVKQIEKTIEARNKDPKYKLRTALPYEFLMPSSGPGITNRGVPQSVSI